MEFLGIDGGLEQVGAWWDAALAYTGPRWLPTVATLLIGMFAYFAARYVLRRANRRWAARTRTKLDDHFLNFFLVSATYSVVAWTAWQLVRVWSAAGPEGVTAAPEGVAADPETAAPRAASWVIAIWVGGLFFPLSRLVGEVLEELEEGLMVRTNQTLDRTAMPLINRAVRVVVVALGVILSLDLLGLNTAPLLTGAGVMGLALSLAAKDTLSNLIAGVQLIMDRPFHVGDRIELWTAPNETGTWGDVVEVGLRATKIRNPDNLVVVVPNNLIMQRDIVNYTMSGEDIRLRIPFSVAYESDIETAKALLIQAAKEVQGVKLSPEPIVIVRGFGASDVQLQLRVWILEARSRRRIVDEITGRALSTFADAGVEIPYPKRELWIHGAPEAPAAFLPPAEKAAVQRAPERSES